MASFSGSYPEAHRRCPELPPTSPGRLWQPHRWPDPADGPRQGRHLLTREVTRRKVSAGTRSDLGRDCRDAFLGLAKTCARHGVAFWTISAAGSRSQGTLLFRHWRNSSDAAGSQPDTGCCPRFCRYYQFPSHSTNEPTKVQQRRFGVDRDHADPHRHNALPLQTPPAEAAGRPLEGPAVVGKRAPPAHVCSETAPCGNRTSTSQR